MRVLCGSAKYTIVLYVIPIMSFFHPPVKADLFVFLEYNLFDLSFIQGKLFIEILDNIFVFCSCEFFFENAGIMETFV